MNKLNRRNFLFLSAAVAAVGANRAVAQYEDLDGETFVVSDSTGAEIDLGATDFEFSSRYQDDRYDAEVILFGNSTGTAAIKFVPTGFTAEEVQEIEGTELVDFYPESEDAGSEILADGFWQAYSIVDKNDTARSVYSEFQLGAFPGYDLIVKLTSNVGSFESDLALMQDVTLAGMPPYLFMEDSEVETLVFPELAVAATGSSGRSSRTTRTSPNPTEEATSEANSGRSTRSGSNSSFVEDVAAHRSEFITGFGDFAESLAVFADDTATDADIDVAFETLVNVSASWEGYPDDAALLSVPAEYADLGDLYLSWADEIGLLGQLWTSSLTRGADLNPAFDQLDVVDLVDKELKAELETYS